MPNTKDFDVRRPGITARVQRLPAVSGLVCKKGDFIPWSTTGCTTPPAAGSNYNPNTQKIAGRAMEDYPLPDGTTPGWIEIEIAEPGVQFPIALFHSTPATAVPALTQLGTAYELKNSALIGGVSIPQVDLTATTNTAVRVVDFIPTYQGAPEAPNWTVGSVAGGVQGALVFVEFLGTACQFTGAR